MKEFVHNISMLNDSGSQTSPCQNQTVGNSSSECSRRLDSKIAVERAYSLRVSSKRGFMNTQLAKQLATF